MTETKKAISKLISDQKWQEALKALKTCCESEPNTLWVWQMTAQAALRLQIWPLAEQALQQILRLNPKQSETYFNLSQLYLLQKDIPKVVQTYVQALKKCSDLNALSAVMITFMASDEIKKGLQGSDKESFQELTRRFCQRYLKPQAELCLRLLELILADDPLDVVALEMRAYLFMQTQHLQSAIADLKVLLTLFPSAERWHNLGVGQIKAGEFDAACVSLREALTMQADFQPALVELVQILLAKKDYVSAVALLSEPLPAALVTEMFASAQYLLNRGNYLLANVCFELCQSQLKHLPITAGSFYLLRAACAHFLVQPDLMEVMLGKAGAEGIHEVVIEQQRLFSVPYAYHSSQEARLIDQQFDFKVQKFKRKAAKAFKSGGLTLRDFSPQPPFLLAYLRRNMLPVMRDLSSFWHDLYQQQGQKLTCTHQPGTRPNLRIGFVSRCFYNHSVLFCYGGLISEMAELPNIEVTVIHLGSQYDSKTRELEESVQHFLHLDEQLEQSGTIAQKILDQELDVLVFTDIGMDPVTYRLGMHRLAPIQMVLLGHPVTTGLPDMDYLLLHCQPDTLAKLTPEYTEALMNISDSLRTERRRPVLDKPVLTRQELGLNETGHIYFCPMTLYKIHPDYDALLAGVLTRDPQGHVYMAKYHESPYHEIIHQRFASAYPELADRLYFLPWMDQHSFYSMIKASDVVLDNLYFAGGTTISMVLGLNVPFLTLPGKFMREHMAASIYNNLKFYDLCATSPEDYINKAVYIATHPEYRAELVKKIETSQDGYFNPKKGLQKLYKVLWSLVKQYPDREIQAE